MRLEEAAEAVERMRRREVVVAVEGLELGLGLGCRRCRSTECHKCYCRSHKEGGGIGGWGGYRGGG